MPSLIALALVAGLRLSGSLAFLDQELLDLRFRATERPATSDLVLVTIDSASLGELESWPWPRGHHAEVLNRLLAAGARRVAFDVDFSSYSDPEMDTRFEQALAAAAGRVVLPVFQQAVREGESWRVVRTQPLPRFRQHAALASINVRPDPDGLVRRMALQERWAQGSVQSLAAVLAGRPADEAGLFHIDFSIDVTGIPRLSYAQVLAGWFDPELVRGRQVLIGATAVELQDVIPVPVHRALPGVSLHALAFQSLLQGRALQPVGAPITLGACLLLTLCFGAWFQKLSSRAGLVLLVGAIVCAFALSLAAQTVAPVIIELAAPVLLLSILYLLGLIGRIDQQGLRLLTQGARLRRLNAVMRDVVEHSFDGIVTFNGEGRIETANLAAHRIFATAGQRLDGRQIDAVIPSVWSVMGTDPGSSPAAGCYETRALRDDGAVFPVELAVSRARIADEDLRVAVVRDITERKAQQAQLEHQALHDPLTGLPNRTLLHDRLKQAVKTAERRGQSVALLVLDLDRFKAINDTLGHPVGDVLLRDVATRLAALLRESETIARTGGDEFAVLLPSGAGLEDAMRIARRMLWALERPFDIQGLELEVGLSVGIALYPTHAMAPEALLQCADIAMYVAKQEQSGTAVYDHDKDRNSVRHLTLTGELRQAIEQDHLALHYQPKLELAGRRVRGAEALVRWQHPVHGFIPPDEFIVHAEQTGLIQPLTRWVIRRALQDCAKWGDAGYPIEVAINLSARNLHDLDLPESLDGLLRETAVEPRRVTMEITESAIMIDPDRALEVVKGLHALGVRLAIDDFGTGYSSLAHLSRLPLDELKIDRTFVMNMTGNENDALIVRSTIELAHSLGLKVVAEGIETEQHLRILHALGCDVGQGFGIARPMEAGAFADWLRARVGTGPAREPAPPRKAAERA